MSAGRRWTVRDCYGNEIYLTHERWGHITEPIGDIQQLGSWWIVGRANGVHAHLLEDHHLALDGAVVDGGAERPQIVVHAHPVQLQTLAVEGESGVGVQRKCANSERRQVGVDRGAVHLQLDLDLIERGRAGRPALG